MFSAPYHAWPLQSSIFYISHLSYFFLIPLSHHRSPGATLWTHGVAVQSTGYASVQLSRQDNEALARCTNLSCRLLVDLLSLRVLRLIFFQQLIMFPVTLGWTSVGGLTENRQLEDMGKRHSKLSALWPCVGGIQAGSDKGQTANCFL